MPRYLFRVPRWGQKIYPGAIWRQDRKASSPLWTIDDGPDPESTLAWLELLERIDQKAVFFFTGRNAERYPDIVQHVRSEGHIIGGHGYNHLDGWKTNKEVYLQDVRRSMTLLETDLFRPPYGRLTLGQYKSLVSTYNIMMWSLISWDYDQKCSVSDIEKCLKKSRMDDIIVFHDYIHSVRKVKVALNTSKIS